ncbi:30S ribosomal protein S11 [Candidatus Shapirobacteria bacterium CG10_big_fil_rev_8_21_14_0_10_40_9]|uniref:Small ribosomal subunit protein uS11 n=1 Tax=Candidatus Shapirobacteria bacterium CG10_big_fil_rev_8_21_14_0_10_40_9 TaxID=1974888 RepID=A0A2M8L3J0_9BACT|nr:MAG: 30S ribosomal protein S11 [Candidatus Shapirobacteria bacterium CG10_big_fil_rev_8_21_14_0_10_40_9]
MKKVKTKKREKIEQAKIFVTATFNNTIVTATDLRGNTVAWESSGSAGFRGTRKATPFAATTTVDKLAKKILELGVREVEVYIKGPGPGRDAALRAIRASGIKMNLIADITPIPHNGTRAKKKRRV